MYKARTSSAVSRFASAALSLALFIGGASSAHAQAPSVTQPALSYGAFIERLTGVPATSARFSTPGPYGVTFELLLPRGADEPSPYWADDEGIMLTDYERHLRKSNLAAVPGFESWQEPVIQIAITRLHIQHPHGWRDDPEDYWGGGFTALDKRAAFEQLLRAGRADAQALESLEYYGVAVDPPMHTRPAPPFADWLSNREVGFEIISPQLVADNGYGFAGFEAHFQYGHEALFNPHYGVFLFNAEHGVLLQFSLELKSSPALADYHHGLVTTDNARVLYPLMKNGFPGPEFSNVRTAILLLRAVASSVRIQGNSPS